MSSCKGNKKNDTFEKILIRMNMQSSVNTDALHALLGKNWLSVDQMLRHSQNDVLFLL